MNVFAWILFGLLAGGIAKFIMPGKDPGGCLLTIIIGIVGSLIGGFLGTRLFGTSAPVTGFNLRFAWPGDSGRIPAAAGVSPADRAPPAALKRQSSSAQNILHAHAGRVRGHQNVVQQVRCLRRDVLLA